MEVKEEQDVERHERWNKTECNIIAESHHLFLLLRMLGKFIQL